TSSAPRAFPKGRGSRRLAAALLAGPPMSVQSTTRARRVKERMAAPASMVWLCLGIVYVVWGSTYLAIRVAVETMPPLLMGAARFVTAGLLLYAVARARGAPSVRTLSRRQLVACWVVGSLLAAGGNGVVN